MSIPNWIKKDVLLKDYNTFRIGGRTKYFTKISSKDKLIKTLHWAKENSLPIFILGNGSNILFSNKKYRGIIIKIENNKVKKINKKTIIVGAGMMLTELLQRFLNKGISGLEWANGIPATVGGVVFSNAGSFGYDVGQFVKKVRTIDLKTCKEKIYLQSDCNFKYRSSVFKKKTEIIWEVELSIKKGNKAKIKEKTKDYWQYKLKNGLFKYPSAGSIFKNLFAKNIPLKYRKGAIIKKGKISTGWFIEKCNLKGKKYGGAMISNFHANVIFNIKNAKANDVLYLINLCKKKVYKKFKIKLEEEIIVVNY
jgi:UDP-N-acetylmuramate dehydrogenase